MGEVRAPITRWKITARPYGFDYELSAPIYRSEEVEMELVRALCDGLVGAGIDYKLTVTRATEEVVA